MCGRFTLAATPDEIRTLFDLPPLPPSPDPGLTDRPRYNVAPTQPILAVGADPGGGRRGVWATWSFAPPAPGRPPLINARAETALSRPSFAAAVRSRRVIVPADGFFEWARVGPRKQPWFIHPWGGGRWAFAAIANPWRRGGLGCAILTVAANEEVAPLHDRMPLILGSDALDRWLDPDLRADDAIAALLAGAPAEIALHPVSPRVGSVANDDATLIDPIELPPDPAPEPSPKSKSSQLGFDW